MVLPTITKSQKIILTFAFIFCLFIQVIPVVRSGLGYEYGIGFWGSNGHDGIWHLALINHIHNPLKINMPVFAGESLKNYHPFFDILIALISKISFIDSSIWLFQIFPLISATLFLYFSYRLGYRLTHSFSGGIILMLLNSINNSLGWIVTFIRSGNFGGESLFWAMQSPSNQLNPPYMLSILLLLILIYLLNTKHPSKILIFLILTFLPIIKVYSALPAFILFLFYVLKNKTYWKTFILATVFASILFLHYNSGSTSLIKFQPFWFTNSMVESIDRFYWPQIIRFLHSSNLIKFLVSETIVFTIFILGNFSWRVLSIFQLKQNRVLMFCILVCIFIPTFFIQSGTSWNTIQFIYYALFLANIPLCLFLNHHLKLSILIIALNILPLIGSLPNYLGKIPPAAISKDEILALNFLKSQNQGTVLTYPYDAYIKKDFHNTPLPIYAYETSSYVAAYSGHQTFLEDEMNLDNSGYDWKNRLKNSQEFFLQKDKYVDRGFLVNNQIDYLYLPKIYLTKIPEFSSEMSLVKIYENTEIVIFKVKR